MDNNFNRQTNTNTSPYQQGSFYQQTNPYTDSSYNSSYNDNGNPEPEKAPNIFRQFVLAFIPTRYNELAKVKTGGMIGFVTLLALIATLISYVEFLIIFAPGSNHEWLDAIPDFEVSDGRLYIDRDYVFDEDGMYVYITDDINGFSYDNASAIAAEGYRTVILIGRDRISLLQNGEYQQGNIRNLGTNIELNKDWIVNTFMPLMKVFATMGYIIFFVARVFWYFLCAAVYLLFALLIASVMKKRQPAGALFRAAVYSKVLMFVLMTFLNVIPFVSIPVPFLLRVAVTIGFMGFAIASLPERN